MRAKLSAAIELHIQIICIGIKMTGRWDWLSDRQGLGVGAAQKEKLNVMSTELKMTRSGSSRLGSLKINE